jgi:hypothetical protein
MRDEELDRVLRGDVEEIEPSSGFAASVMEAVRAEAEMPPPIPFPWGRAVPGFVAVLVALVLVVVLFLRVGGGAVVWPPEMVRMMGVAGWILGGLVVALVSVGLAARMAGARG